MKVYKRDRIWYTYYTYQGKRRRKAVGPYKAAAELKLKDIAFKLALGEDPDPETPEEKHILFKDYASEYLDYSKTNKTPETVRREKYILKILVEMFGDESLSDMTPKQIEQYKQRRLEQGNVKHLTVNRELGTLSHMLNKAVQWGYITETPMKGVKRLRQPTGRLRFLEPMEIDALLNQCSPHLRPIVVTALNTGMRKSEILTLRWSNVNLRARTITIHESKNNERRIIPINPTLQAELEALCRRRKSDFVFSQGNGKPYEHIWHGFTEACRRAGISDFRFHDLRHTFASHLVMGGVNLRAVQELLGHKDIRMTMRYSHLSGQHLQEAVGILGLRLTGEMQKQMDSVTRKKDDKLSKVATNTPQQKTEVV